MGICVRRARKQHVTIPASKEILYLFSNTFCERKNAPPKLGTRLIFLPWKFLSENYQRFVSFDGLTCRDVEFFYGTVGVGGDFVLHLHCLKNQEHVAGFDC